MQFYIYQLVHHNTGCQLGGHINFGKAYDRMVEDASKHYTKPCRIVDVDAINGFEKSSHDNINIKFIVNETEIYYIYASLITIYDCNQLIDWEKREEIERDWKKYLKENYGKEHNIKHDKMGY